MPQISEMGKIIPASPIRKLVPYADQAKEKGIKVYHLNIGQPDIETPPIALEAVRNMKLSVIGGQIFPRGYKIRLYGIIVTPQDLFQCAALRPVQALDREIQKRCHHAAHTFSDLRKLPAVKENVSDGQLRAC